MIFEKLDPQDIIDNAYALLDDAKRYAETGRVEDAIISITQMMPYANKCSANLIKIIKTKEDSILNTAYQKGLERTISGAKRIIKYADNHKVPKWFIAVAYSCLRKANNYAQHLKTDIKEKTQQLEKKLDSLNPQPDH
ncbi:hypothetical protein KY332_03685 [Candidatus Woesearchaeota archaeon]|nr:hypothetical protein [Candidatus Woesearchaeota archaeon]